MKEAHSFRNVASKFNICCTGSIIKASVSTTFILCDLPAVLHFCKTNAKPYIACVDIHMHLTAWIEEGQSQVISDGCFRGIERSLARWSPVVAIPSALQCPHWFSKCSHVWKEETAVSNKTEKRLELLDVHRGWGFLVGSIVLCIWLNAIRGQNPPMERQLGLAKQTLVQLQAEVLCMKMSENLSKDGVMLFNGLCKD